MIDPLYAWLSQVDLLFFSYKFGYFQPSLTQASSPKSGMSFGCVLAWQRKLYRARLSISSSDLLKDTLALTQGEPTGERVIFNPVTLNPQH